LFPSEVTVSIFSVSSSSAAISNPKRGRLALLALAGFSLFGATGCYARVRARPAVVSYEYQAPATEVYYEEPVVYVQAAPVVEIESYPRYYYRGSYVYYVDGRWYSRGSRGWTYYRAEPRDLVRYRSSVEFTNHPRVRVHAHAEAPRVRVETPRVEAHVQGGVHVGGHAGTKPEPRPAKPQDRERERDRKHR
jgi:hypothetical protein